MTRMIKSSEIKPGMTIRWETEMTIKGTTECNGVGGVLVWEDNVTTEYLGSDAKITVVSEPQPEEPTEFGAKVRVRKGRFVRLVEGDAGFLVWFEEGTESWWTWDELCEMGPVTVVPDQGWEVPADAPEVPDRIEEWPEDDEHLRAYSWRDHDGDTWGWLNDEAEWECRSSVDIRLGTSRRPDSGYGPWTRITDS